MSKSLTKTTPKITDVKTCSSQIGIKFNLTKSVPPFVFLVCYLQLFALTAWSYLTGDFSQMGQQRVSNKIALYSGTGDTIEENGHLVLTIPNPNHIPLYENPQISQYFVFFEEVKH